MSENSKKIQLVWQRMHKQLECSENEVVSFPSLEPCKPRLANHFKGITALKT